LILVLKDAESASLYLLNNNIFLQSALFLSYSRKTDLKHLCFN